MKTNNKARQTYFLDNKLKKNPEKYCPECNSTQLEHFVEESVDPTDIYNCKKCGFKYEICNMTSKEADYGRC